MAQAGIRNVWSGRCFQCHRAQMANRLITIRAAKASCETLRRLIHRCHPSPALSSGCCVMAVPDRRCPAWGTVMTDFGNITRYFSYNRYLYVVKHAKSGNPASSKQSDERERTDVRNTAGPGEAGDRTAETQGTAALHVLQRALHQLRCAQPAVLALQDTGIGFLVSGSGYDTAIGTPPPDRPGHRLDRPWGGNSLNGTIQTVFKNGNYLCE